MPNSKNKEREEKLEVLRGAIENKGLREGPLLVSKACVQR